MQRFSRLNPTAVLLGLFGLLASVAIASAAESPARPRITGIDHVTIYVADVKKSRQFYSEVLGLTAECPQFRGPESCLLVRPSNQRVLLKPTPTEASNLKSWVAEIAFAIDDVERMR